MIERSDIPLVFIGGCPRSGTTLMKRALDAHSQIYCGPEFGHLPAICELYKRMKQGVEARRIESYSNIESLREYICDFILKFFRPVIVQNNVQIFAEKTPDNVMHFCTLHELFPDAKFIHVIRNPLDVVASYMRVGERRSVANSPSLKYEPEIKKVSESSVFDSALLAAQHWKKQVFFPRRLGDIFSSPEFQSNYIEVKYEDLVTNSEVTVKKICDFIGVEFEIGMLQLARPLGGDASIFGGTFYNQQEYVRGITNTGIERWRESLTKEDVCTVIKEVKHYLIKYGYMTNEQTEEVLNEGF